MKKMENEPSVGEGMCSSQSKDRVCGVVGNGVFLEESCQDISEEWEPLGFG